MLYYIYEVWHHRLTQHKPNHVDHRKKVGLVVVYHILHTHCIYVNIFNIEDI